MIQARAFFKRLVLEASTPCIDIQAMGHKIYISMLCGAITFLHFKNIIPEGCFATPYPTDVI